MENNTTSTVYRCQIERLGNLLLFDISDYEEVGLSYGAKGSYEFLLAGQDITGQTQKTSPHELRLTLESGNTVTLRPAGLHWLVLNTVLDSGHGTKGVAEVSSSYPWDDGQIVILSLSNNR